MNTNAINNNRNNKYNDVGENTQQRRDKSDDLQTQYNKGDALKK